MFAEPAAVPPSLAASHVDSAEPAGIVASLRRLKAPIAQLDRALVYGTRCRKFESSWARHHPPSSVVLESSELERDIAWMTQALGEADAAALEGEVPVGCVVVGSDGEELGRGRNAREALADPTAHAETIAIRAAAKRIGGWRLEGSTAYVTLEPCAMCAGALVLARVARVVYGCADPKAGAVATLYAIGRDARLNHRFELAGGVLEAECGERLRRFFAALRAR
jgi:tRNA(adenine34) deaminase